MTIFTISRLKNRQRGFTLIEVLVTVLILAIGLLGLAGLQTTALRSNHSAYLRSQATVLAYDIVDRMRANRNAALAGQYNSSIGGGASGSGMVATDLTAWKGNLQAMLPSGDGAIALAAGGRFTITVQWDDSRGAIGETAGVTTKQFILRTDL